MAGGQWPRDARTDVWKAAKKRHAIQGWGTLLLGTLPRPESHSGGRSLPWLPQWETPAGEDSSTFQSGHRGLLGISEPQVFICTMGKL